MSENHRQLLLEKAAAIEAAVSEWFHVQDTTLGLAHQPDTIRLRGALKIPSHQAYPKLAQKLRALGYTAMLQRDESLALDVLLAVPGIPLAEGRSRLWVNALLYVLTLLATLFVGASWSDQVPANADWVWIATHLWMGWPFALSLMVILTGHELGHYFAGRYYKVPVSLPYFIPMPVPPLGTMGAFIIMKGQTVDRRQMLTVGAAGPLVGFFLAVPLLILGLSLSTVGPMLQPEPGTAVFVEGNSLLYLLIKYALFGQILPGSGPSADFLQTLSQIGAALFGLVPIDQGIDVHLHPVALAAWAGLLVTAFNLMPVGQLDGGHVLYSLVGQRARLLTWPVIGFLALLGLLFWQGWFLWAALIFLFGQSHPDPLDDITRLDAPRKIIAVLVLLIFLLTFTPLPMQLIVGEAPAPGAEQVLGLGALVAGLVGAQHLARRARG